MKAKVVTWQELAETFTIADGELWRKLKTGRLKRVPTNPDESGYIKMSFKNKMYRYHRILYMLHHQVSLTGEQVIDHIIEGNRANNRIDNLQVTNPSDNQRKSVIRKLPSKRYGKYNLTASVKGHQIYIGSYDEAGYWRAYAKRERLFGVGTTGLVFAKTLSNADAKEFIQLAMSA